MRITSIDSRVPSYIDPTKKQFLMNIEGIASKEEIEPIYNCFKNNQNINISSLTKKKEPLFGGFYTINNKDIYIKRVIYTNPTVVVIWSDGVKTRSTCHKEDKWNPEFGLTLCVIKRFLSNNQINKLFEDWYLEDCITEKPVDIKLSNVRNKHKLKVNKK